MDENPGNQPMYSSRISNLFANNPLFNIKPRNQTDTLEEEDECSEAGMHEPKTPKRVVRTGHLGLIRADQLGTCIPAHKKASQLIRQFII